MGLPRAAINLLLNLATSQPFSGRIATLGRQHVYVKQSELQTLARKAGVPLANANSELHRDPLLRQQGYVSDECLYELLGFQQSLRIDHSDYEAAEEHLDLNQPETPLHLCGAFDVVLDSGTIEHVFNIGQAMRHCLNMTRPGGRIIHLTPSSNAVNHGFYSVSPSLYTDFYEASGCALEKLWICQAPANLERGEWLVYDCRGTDRNWLPLGRLNGSVWFTFAVVRKQSSTHSATPQQSFYVSTWNEKPTESNSRQTGSSSLLDDEPADSRSGRLLALTSTRPLVHACARRFIMNWRRLVNWYRERRRGRIPFPFVSRF